jgi:cellulose synthase/poly-beta-1,6-N-acetylglucosamine synthase-like glycosyltransferase
MQLNLSQPHSPGSEDTLHPRSQQPVLPQATVIVPIYNGEADLPDLIHCLQAQTYPTEQVEYLLVDNASRDRTAELIQAAEAAAKLQGLNLRYLSETQIQSSYAARNRGIRAASGEILAFTDADCRPQPGWLEALVQPFADPRVGLVSGAIEALPGETLIEQYTVHKQILSNERALAHDFRPFGQTANLAVRRQVLAEVGLFRAHLTTGGDADFCWRVLAQPDWNLAFAPQALVQHRHRTTLSGLIKQFQRYGRSSRYLHELHGSDLKPDLKFYQLVYRFSRWLVRDFPITGVQVLRRQATPMDLWTPPLSLITAWARATGQRRATLPDQVSIEHL